MKASRKATRILQKALKTFAAAALAAAVIVPPTAFASFYTPSLFTSEGSAADSRSEELSGGFLYSETGLAVAGAGMRRLRVFDYHPGRGTGAAVIAGDVLASGEPLNEILEKNDANHPVPSADAQTREAKLNEYDVAGAFGITGYGDGSPFSLVMENGVVKSNAEGYPALGFTENGLPVIGDPGIHIEMYKIATYSAAPIFLNQTPSATGDGVYLLNSDFGETTGTSFKSTEITLRIESGSFRVGDQMTCTVIDVDYDAMNTPIPEGCIVVSVSEKFNDWYRIYSNLLLGNSILIDITCSVEFSEVKYAVGGNSMLIENSELTEINDAATDPTNGGRAAAGLKADGSLVLIAADGEKGDFRSLSASEAAQALKDIGCTTAINLTSGTTAAAAARMPGSEYAASDSSQPVSAAILFYNDERVTGEPFDLKLTPITPSILGGSTVSFRAFAYDTTMHPLGECGGVTAFGFPEKFGSFTGATLKTNKAESAAYIDATAVYNGTELKKTMRVYIASSVDKLVLEADSSLFVKGASVPIKTTAYKDGAALLSSPDAFTYSLASTNPIGSVDENGVLYISATASGSDVLTVSYGGVSASLPIAVRNADGTVTDPERDGGMLHTFESGDVALDVFTVKKSSTSAVNSSMLLAEGHDFSQRSLYFSYSFPKLTIESARYMQYQYKSPQEVPASAAGIGLWAKSYAPGENGVLYATVEDARGNQYDCEYTSLGDAAAGTWQYLFASFESIPAVKLTVPLKVADTGMRAVNGFVIIDDIAFSDKKPEPLPEITVAVTEPETGTRAFADSGTAAWAEEYIEAMFEKGYAEGSIGEDGLRYYHPSNNLTREEFAKMLVSLLGINTKLFGGISFGFIDSPSISAWAEPYIKAAVSSELMKGSLNGDGTYSFMPKNFITRQEVMHVFGKLLGDTDVKTLSFGDSHLVASWAFDNVVKTVAAGVIRGDEAGNLNPLGYVTRAEIAAIFIRSEGMLSFDD